MLIHANKEEHFWVPHHIPRRASHKLVAQINKTACTVVTVPFPWNWSQRHHQHSSRAAAVVKEALKSCWKWLLLGLTCGRSASAVGAPGIQVSSPEVRAFRLLQDAVLRDSPLHQVAQGLSLSAAQLSALFPGIKVPAAGSKEARMDSHWSQRPWMLLAVCGTSKVHGNEEMEKTCHFAHKWAHKQDSIVPLKNRWMLRKDSH